MNTFTETLSDLPLFMHVAGGILIAALVLFIVAVIVEAA